MVALFFTSRAQLKKKNLCAVQIEFLLWISEQLFFFAGTFCTLIFSPFTLENMWTTNCFSKCSNSCRGILHFTESGCGTQLCIVRIVVCWPRLLTSRLDRVRFHKKNNRWRFEAFVQKFHFHSWLSGTRMHIVFFFFFVNYNLNKRTISLCKKSCVSVYLVPYWPRSRPLWRCRSPAPDKLRWQLECSSCLRTPCPTRRSSTPPRDPRRSWLRLLVAPGVAMVVHENGKKTQP